MAFECPITMERFRDPVVLFPSGNTYELEAVQSWFTALEGAPLTDPCTRQKCAARVVPNWTLRSAMHEQGLGAELLPRTPGEEIALERPSTGDGTAVVHDFVHNILPGIDLHRSPSLHYLIIRAE